MGAELTVRERMVSPVLTLAPETPLSELTDFLLAKKISAVPLTEGDRLVGIVSTTDLLADLAKGGGSYTATRASEVMQRPVLTTHAGATIADAAASLARSRVHRLVVTEPTETDRVVGILAASDLLGDVKARPTTRTLSDLMVRAIATVDVGMPVDEAVTSLGHAHVHGVVVVDGTRPVGVLTHREALLSRRLSAALRAQPVVEIMSYETICLDDDTPVSRAAAYAVAMTVRRILVVHHGRLVGIVSALDLVGTLQQT